MNGLGVVFIIFMLVQGVYAKDFEKTLVDERSHDERYLRYFKNKVINQKPQFQFNKYENIISGFAAFAIGNIGYFTTDSDILKLSYAGIQTIGVINIGRGIYKYNAPNYDLGMYQVLGQSKGVVVSKKLMAYKLIQLTAQEERARRLSLFYSSSFLAVQYFLNSFVDDSAGKLKNIYTFLGGVNVIVAVYSYLKKNEYEKFFYGNNYDIMPFYIPKSQNSSDATGIRANIHF